jgi:hypothetical protein
MSRVRRCAAEQRGDEGRELELRGSAGALGTEPSGGHQSAGSDCFIKNDDYRFRGRCIVQQRFC